MDWARVYGMDMPGCVFPVLSLVMLPPICLIGQRAWEHYQKRFADDLHHQPSQGLVGDPQKVIYKLTTMRS